MKNKTTATLFAFFLGMFGAHRFYVGQKLWGIIYLLSFGIARNGCLSVKTAYSKLKQITALINTVVLGRNNFCS